MFADDGRLFLRPVTGHEINFFLRRAGGQASHGSKRRSGFEKRHMSPFGDYATLRVDRDACFQTTMVLRSLRLPTTRLSIVECTDCGATPRIIALLDNNLDAENRYRYRGHGLVNLRAHVKLARHLRLRQCQA